METQTSINVANWLRGLQNVNSATPVFVQIRHRHYPAAKYTEDQNGVEETRLYIVGEMPPFHNRMRRICYRTDDSGCDWHVIAWFEQRSACIEWQEVHRFGSHFILAQWSLIENWAADQCEKRPFHRLSMTITDCGPTNTDVNQPTEEMNNDTD